MKKLPFFACVAALTLGLGQAQASVVTFDVPQLLDPDPVTSAVTYLEAGLRLTGIAPGFGQIDGIGVGGSPGLFLLTDYALQLTRADGGLFRLLSITAGPLDPMASPAELVIQMLRADGTQDALILAQGGFHTYVFPDTGPDLSALTFSSAVDFILDNIETNVVAAEVPEPSSLLLMGAALVGWLGLRRRKSASV